MMVLIKPTKWRMDKKWGLVLSLGIFFFMGNAFFHSYTVHKEIDAFADACYSSGKLPSIEKEGGWFGEWSGECKE